MNHSHPSRCAVVVYGLLVSLAGGCTFSSPDPFAPPEQQAHDAINAAPLLPIAESSRYTVMETAGKMTLMQGQTCAFPKRGAGDHHVGFRVHESVKMPAGYTGVVYLNGFRGDYDDGDRNFLGLGAMIVRVDANRDKGELQWEAGGVLGDNSGDDAYKWCYWYGVVLWNPAAPELQVAAFQDDSDPKRTTFIHHDDFDPGNDGAVRDLPGMFVDPERREPKAVVPRGFGLIYTEDDYNLLQAGFDLGLPQASGTSIAWTSRTVLKDNDERRDYRGSALVSILLGESVHVWQPEKVSKRDATSNNGAWEQVPGNDFALVARSDADWCGADDVSFRKFEYVVDDVPFDYALPVLNGWDHGNFCGDSNVESSGVWLTEVSYEKQPGSPGKMRYAVASMFDDDGGWFGSDGNLTSHGVVILGFNELTKGSEHP